ncbi:MAG: biopolymer transporter ExbD [Flavobacteriales bacterium]|nr:biopolymer transporter ExbD [Flavobacteriales bacterium]
MNLRSRNKVEASFNMSSMTDLVFLLLIFFMILSTMVKSNNVMSVQLPSATTKEKAQGVKVRISIDKDLNYYLNKTQVPFEQLDALLKEKMVGQEDAKVEIAVDESVPHKYFVEVADLVSVQNGFKMVLVTQNKK